ncbi:alpha/beta fold hydrolase [Aliiglaciecola lipolytica]|uniref:alpha/beta fold hydrolase n=1 Tax=Aliiglaciecola lipolytica TaxID=477689 RepID=UPI001C084AF1|nr:alpha/beta hydrolase [Aliiglaciecola lipolytica]MBU2878990.1 alpha/beta hydrolase [Aliiglaciecola lipolytica]
MIKRILKWVSGTLLVVFLVFIGVLVSMRAGMWNPAFEDVKQKHAIAPSKFVKVGDTTLHVRDEGEGPVIIMLHSSMTNLRIYDDWANRLKTDYRVIRIDWPPYGLTTDPKPSIGMPGVVALLEKFVEQEGLDKFTLVGSSSGSTISVLYAASHPEQVRALALSTLPLSAPPTSEPPFIVTMVQYFHQNWVPNYLPRFYYESSLGWLYGVSSRLKPETVTWYYETNNTPGKFAQVKQYYQANVKAVWSKADGAGKEAAQVTAPILLQWGDIDPVLPIDLVPGAVAEFENTDVKVIHYPDVGHYPMLELPDETGKDLKDFIDQIHAQELP